LLLLPVSTSRQKTLAPVVKVAVVVDVVVGVEVVAVVVEVAVAVDVVAVDVVVVVEVVAVAVEVVAVVVEVAVVVDVVVLVRVVGVVVEVVVVVGIVAEVVVAVGVVVVAEVGVAVAGVGASSSVVDQTMVLSRLHPVPLAQSCWSSPTEQSRPPCRAHKAAASACVAEVEPAHEPSMDEALQTLNGQNVVLVHPEVALSEQHRTACLLVDSATCVRPRQTPLEAPQANT